MPGTHDRDSSRTYTGNRGEPYLMTLTDGDRSLRFESEDRALEPVNGWIWKQCTGDGVLTTFTFPDKLPPNCLVETTAVIVLNTSGTAATTLALGIAGTTGRYMAATSFTSSMATAGAKAVTAIRVWEQSQTTPTSPLVPITVIATFSAAWDTGAKVLVGVKYVKLPFVV